MAVILGVWLAVAGGVAVLAGLAGARRRNRLRRSGRPAWAMILPAPVTTPDADPWLASVRVQFELEDGRVIERVQAVPSRRPGAWRPGRHVLVWYDPADPSDVLVYGSDGRWSDRILLTAGGLAILAGTILTGYAS